MPASCLAQAGGVEAGGEVSLSELARTVGIDVATIKRLLDLLEKAFIIFRLNQYRRNERVVVGRKRKVYFYDLGVRNGLISAFSQLKARTDQGALWENFCIVERMKALQSAPLTYQHHYWRHKTGQEIDLIETVSQKTSAYEFKYTSKPAKPPSQFVRQYPEVGFQAVFRDNLADFIK